MLALLILTDKIVVGYFLYTDNEDIYHDFIEYAGVVINIYIYRLYLSLLSIGNLK